MPDHRPSPRPGRTPVFHRREWAHRGSGAGRVAGLRPRRGPAVRVRGLGAPGALRNPGRETNAIVGIVVVLLAGALTGGCGGGSAVGDDGWAGAAPPSPVAVGSEPGAAVRPPAGPGGTEPDIGPSGDRRSVDHLPGDPDRNRCAALDRFAGRVGEAAAVGGDPTRAAALAEHLGSDLVEVEAAPEDLRRALAVWRDALLELGANRRGPGAARAPAVSASPTGRAPDAGARAADPAGEADRVAAVLARPEVVAALDRIEREVRGACP